MNWPSDYVNQIIQGDCLDVMKGIPDQSIDMILCDLPYGVADNSWDSVIPIMALWARYKRIIKPNGAIVLTAVEPFTSTLVMSWQKGYRHKWIWNKNNSAGFATAKYRPFQICEDVLVFSKETVRYYPIMEQRGKPRNKDMTSKSANYQNGNLRPQETGIKSDMYYPKNLLEFSAANQRGKVHPTQKPVELFEYLIKTYTNEGDLVLDNTIGSGTTAVACINTNRRFIGIELDERYCEIARKRMDEARQKLDNFA